MEGGRLHGDQWVLTQDTMVRTLYITKSGTTQLQLT